MSHRSLAATLLFLALSSWSLQAQDLVKKSAPEDPAVPEATRKKAVELLLSVGSQVNTLRSGENRARIGSNLVESLWDYDETRARSLLATVQEDITAGLSDTDPDYESHRQTLMVFLQLRRDTVTRLSRHDPELALSFLLASRPRADIQLPYGMKDAETNLELQLAEGIAAKSPQLALKLGRQALARGLSTELKSVLLKLHAGDKEAGQSFYQEIIERLKTTNLAQDSLALAFALDLALSFQPPRATEHVYRDLLGVVLASAIANGCATADPEADETPNICYQTGSIFSQLEKYHGVQAAALKRWVDPEADTERRMQAEWREIVENVAGRTVDETLALAEKYPDNKAQIYWHAFEKAAESGDLARARQLAVTVPYTDLREHMQEQLQRYEKYSSIAEQKVAATQQRVSQLPNDEARTQYLIEVAMQIGGKDRKAALGFLDQAAQIIGGTKPGRKEIEERMGLAMLYCSLKSERGFALMESLIPKLNELVAAAVTLDGFDNKYLREGEWNMSAQSSLGGLLNTLAQNAGYFAHFDFDRAATLAGQFERIELRLMAQLKLAQSALKPQTNFSPMVQRRREVIIY